MWRFGIPMLALILLAAIPSASAMPISDAAVQEPATPTDLEFVKRGHGGKHGRHGGRGHGHRGGHGHGHHGHGHHGHHHGHIPYWYWRY